VVSQINPVVLGKADMSASNRSLVMQGLNNVTGAGGKTDYSTGSISYTYRW